MAQFLILIYEAEASYASGDKETYDRVLAAHDAFGQKHATALRGGNALAMTSNARTVRDGVVTDGPFLETQEALGGYYVVEADSLDEAVTIAHDVPAEFGCVEVRPVMVFG